MPGKKHDFTHYTEEDIDRVLYTRICPEPSCGEIFTVGQKQGRQPVYCSPECKSRAGTISKAHIPRNCAYCAKHYETDMRGMTGTPSDYCSEECKTQYQKLNTYRNNHSCTLRGCFRYIQRARSFCSAEHCMAYHQESPETRLHTECLLDGCTESPSATFNPEDLRLCPKFCCEAHRNAFAGQLPVAKQTRAHKKANATSRKKAKTYRRAAKGEAFRMKPAGEFGYMLAGHNTKTRWGTRINPAECSNDRALETGRKFVRACLLTGWQSEEEFFTTEDTYPPAHYLKVQGVPPSDRPKVHLPIKYQNKGEGESKIMEPDTHKPSPEELDTALSEILTAYLSETEEPEYITAYRAATGADPTKPR